MTERTQPAPRTWTAWGEILTAVVAVGTTLGLGGAWALQYFSRDGNARLIERVTYIVEDRSWMPPGVSELQPLIGYHYFGDLAIALGYGESLNPFIIAGMPSQNPPVAIFFYRLLGIFGSEMALVFLVMMSALLVPLAVWKLMGGVSVAGRITTVVLLVWITMPMISALDRGGLQFVAVGFLGLSVMMYSKQRSIWAIVFFVIAVSLKSYLLVFILYPLVRGHRSFALKALVTAILINGVLFLAFPGRPTVSFGGLFTSTLFYSRTEMVLDGSSLASLPLKFVEMTQGTDAALALLYSSSLWLTLLAVIWLAVVGWLASRSAVPYWVSLTLVFASATMVVGAAFPYNYAGMALAAFYFGSFNSDPFPIRGPNATDAKDRGDEPQFIQNKKGLDLSLRIATMVTIAVSLVPQFWIWTGPSGDGSRAISILPPAAITLLTIFAFIYWLASRKSQRATSLIPHQSEQQ